MLHTATANTPVRKDCEDSNLPWVSVHVAYQHAHNLYDVDWATSEEESQGQ